VSISISDVNDNDPQFASPVYEFTAPENEGGYVVGSVSADDADTISSLLYKFEYPNSYFSIDSNGVIRTTRALDYETQPQHNFSVEVTDGPPSPRKGRALVIVNVIDKADSVPRFVQTTYNVDVEERKIGPFLTVEVSVENA